MGLLADARIKAAIAGLIVAVLSIKIPALDSSTATTIATSIVTFVVGLIINSPGTAARTEAAVSGKAAGGSTGN